MADEKGFVITKDHRKAFYRVSRKLIYSYIIMAMVALVFFGVNPFYFWDTPGHVFVVLALWIISYHIFAALKKHAAGG